MKGFEIVKDLVLQRKELSKEKWSELAAELE
jgi:hypothetical protein